ncbi:MAG TPA: sulfite exporter TauE/SafE family protein [Puia sp.]|nr:sulfite exporter TauE/SafE family protein [Puia sp.]
MILCYLVAISFFATLVRSTFGFGESLVAVPLFALVVPLEVAVPLAVLVSVLVASVVVAQDHRKVHVYSAKWLIASAIPGIPIGLLILIRGNAYWVKVALGLLIIGYCISMILAKGSLRLERESKGWMLGCGFLSGVLGGAYGLNGPPLVIYGHLRRWSAAHFRATLQAYFLVVSLIGLTGYAIKGLVGWAIIRDFLWCLPAIVPAIFWGRWLNRRLHGEAFYGYVNWGLILIGLLLIGATVAGKAVTMG